VVKPFAVRELLARVEAVLRRSPSRRPDRPAFKVPGGRADTARGEIRFDDGRTCPLSGKEAELLRYLAANAGRTVSREEILLHVWQVRPEGIETRTIDMHVARLREKLGDDAASPAILKTVRGEGYLFEATGAAS
jgi:DNA-binding response OmpR family regulator